jgi:hypothetical protein
MTRQAAVESLLHHTPGLWKGNRAASEQSTLPSGYRRLDAALPGGGWPLGAVTEIMAQQGLGELSLLLPALARQGQEGRWLIMVDPPWVPYPAALHGHGMNLDRLLLVRSRNRKESLWACEQALNGCRGGAVLAWPGRIGFRSIRRLQLAARHQGGTAFLFRPAAALGEASPAALRLHLMPGPTVSILKCRGPRPTEPIHLGPLMQATGHQPAPSAWLPCAATNAAHESNRESNRAPGGRAQNQAPPPATIN